MSRILAIINQKGGVGKTTTAVNLCAALAKKDFTVLAIDLDPQCHMTAHFGMSPSQDGLDRLFTEGGDIRHFLNRAREGIDLLQPGPRLNELEGLASNVRQGYLLRDLITEILKEQDYDFIIVDCPPSSGLLGMNALLGCRELVIPVTGDYLTLVGLSRLMSIVSKLESRTSQGRDKHIVFTRFQKRRRHAREVREKVAEHFPDALCRSVISESVTLTESPSFGKTIDEYRKSSRSTQEYAALAQELIERTHVRHTSRTA